MTMCASLHPPHDPRLATFVREAEAFGALVERYAQVERGAWLVEVHGRLVTLYASAIALPDRDALADREDQSTAAPVPRVHYALVSADARYALSLAIAAYLGDDDTFYDLIDATDADAELVPSSLAQEITGIHRDLRAGLSTWETEGLAMGLWHWRTFFETSWNRSLSGVLRALESRARAHPGTWPVAVAPAH